MDSREKTMALNSSRPDERKREEARLARANQIRPMVDPEAVDNSFSRVMIPSNEIDPMSKTILEVLGPFSSYLTMSSSYLPLKARELEKQKAVTSVTNESTPKKTSTQDTSLTGKSNLSQPPLSTTPVDAKRPSSLYISKSSANSSTVMPRSSTILPPPSGNSNLTSNQINSSSLSSSVDSVKSPQNSKDLPVEKLRDGGIKYISHQSKEPTPPPHPVSSKSKTASHSPAKEVVSDLPPSKPAKPNSLSEHSSNNKPGMSLSSVKDHRTNILSKQPTSSLMSNASVGSNPQHSKPSSPVLPAPIDSSPVTVKVSSSPNQRSKSATPPKSGVKINGLNLPHSTPSSLLQNSKTIGHSADKSKVLKLQIPSENSLTKSDLNDILKEMTDVQPLHSAIETPQKSDKIYFNTKDTIKLHPSNEESHDKKADKFKNNFFKEGRTTPVATSKLLNNGDTKVPPLAEGSGPHTLAHEVVLVDTSAAAVSRADAKTPSDRRPAGVKSMGKAIRETDSILYRDLDLSEDSDSAPEDNTCVSQSKKGKVISPTSSGKSPSEGRHERSLSASSSSSDESSGDSSSSESDSSDSDDDEQLDGQEKRRSDPRLSSSSSSSSSDSSSDSESEDGDNDEEEEQVITRDDDVRAQIEITPSPSNTLPASVGTPNTVENQDISRSWNLLNFLPPAKKSSTSPVTASPSKPMSPPTSVQPKDDKASYKQRTLKEIGQCKSEPFDVTVAGKLSDEDALSRYDDDDNKDDIEETFQAKSSHTSSVRKSSNSSFKDSFSKSDMRKYSSKESTVSPPTKKEHKSSKTTDDKSKEMSPLNFNKKLHPSSSEDEIDVVGLTPIKIEQLPKKSPHNKQHVPLTNGNILSSSDEDNKKAMATNKNTSNNPVKHHKRKKDKNCDKSNEEKTKNTASNSGGASSLMLTSDLESISRPPNLLSPLHSDYPVSERPLPSFQASFSPPASVPAPSKSCVSSIPDKGEIFITIQNSLIAQRQLEKLQERKRNRQNLGAPEPYAAQAQTEPQPESHLPPRGGEGSRAEKRKAQSNGSLNEEPVNPKMLKPCQSSSVTASTVPSSSDLSSKPRHNPAVKNLNFDTAKKESDEPKNPKRKLENGEELLTKKSKIENLSDVTLPEASSQPASIHSRKDSSASNSSRASQISNKKPRRISNKNSNNNDKIVDKTEETHISSSPDLPFNAYANGEGALMAPEYLLTQIPSDEPLKTTEYYLARAKEHKHGADNMKDKVAKLEPYLRSGLNFFLAGYTIEKKKKDLNAAYSLYNDTSNFLQFVLRSRPNNNLSIAECSDLERKVLVLIIRLRALLNHRSYYVKKSEVNKFKQVIDSEQSKLNSSSSTPSSSNNSSNKATAPSPHQNSFNKTSTGVPSPMSPTPSPATSVSSQGSCELVPGKTSNGTSQISPTAGMVTVQQRVHSVTQKYIALTSHVVKALDLWEQADAEARGLDEFFSIVNKACDVLTFHSEPQAVVRYMKFALRLLPKGS